MSQIHNLAMEQCVLAALMTVENSLESVINDLTADSFYAERHKHIFNAIVDLANDDRPYDIVMVEQRLIDTNAINLCGGEQYIRELYAEAPASFYNIESYVVELNKLKAHREVEKMGESIANIARDLTCDDVFLKAENIISRADSNPDKQKTSHSFEEAIEKSIERMIEKEKARHNKGFTGVQFNIPLLDNMLGVIERGHFCVVGGRPGSGKSTLAQMLMIQTASTFKKPVLFISAEMDVETLTNRCMSALSHIPYDNIHNGQIYDGMFEKFAQTQAAYKKLPIRIESKQKPTIAEVHAYARSAKRKYKELGCIIVDYLGLVRDPSKKDRVQEVSSISRDLKAMAKEFDCPVIALAQLNRESEKNKRPVASDLKDSGQIEQDADQIIMVHPIVDKDEGQPTGMTELVIAKNRHGKRGVVVVRDRLDICRFVGVVQEVVDGAA